MTRRNLSVTSANNKFRARLKTLKTVIIDDNSQLPQPVISVPYLTVKTIIIDDREKLLSYLNQYYNKVCARLKTVFSSTIRSIWRAVLLTSASASASPVLIKVLVQLHIFCCTFKSFYGIHLKLKIYVPYHHPYHMW